MKLSTDFTDYTERRRLFFISLCNLWMVFLFTSSSFAQAPPGPSSPLYGARPAHGNPATGLPEALQEVRIEQKLDQQLPLDLVFRDESGQQVKLGQYFGRKPVVPKRRCARPMSRVQTHVQSRPVSKQAQATSRRRLWIRRKINTSSCATSRRAKT